MSTVITFILIGLAAGAAYTGIALGIVVTYKGTGTVNFAAGAMAAWGAFVFDELRRKGQLWLPIPLNHSSQLGHGHYGGVPLVLFAIVSAAVFALVARAVVARLVRRRSPSAARVISLLGMIGAVPWGIFVLIHLRSTGRYFLPIIPFRFHVGVLSFPVALVLSLVLTSLLGLAVHVLIFRPMRSAPPLAKVVASVGLMSTLVALMALRFGTTPRSVHPIFPAEKVDFAGVSVARDRLYLAAAAILISGALWAYFRFTRPGLATRAAAESERNAALRGWSPDLLAGGTWVIASVVSTLLVILTLPIIPLSQTAHTLMIAPALACALVGRLTSIAATATAALSLGALQSVLAYESTRSWWPSWAQAGLNDAIPFVILIVVLFLLGQKLPTRATLQPDPLPRVVIPRNRPQVIVPLIIGAIALVCLTQGGWRFGVITSMILTIAALSIVLLTGLTGQISLAQAALAGLAGFALSKLSAHGIGFPWSVLLSAAIAAAFGVVVGLPALRIRGARLAVVTLALAVAIEKFIFRNPSFAKPGGEPVPDASFFGIDLSIRAGRNIARWQFGIMVVIVLALVGLFVSNIIRGSAGRRFIALRGNERAATAVGINVAANKLVAFALSAFIAGIAGSLIGYSRNQLSAESFSTFVNVSFVAFAYLGGITSMSGAMIGGFLGPLGLSFILTDRLFQLGPNYSLVAGVGVIFMAIMNPVGIAGANRQMWELVKKKFGSLRKSSPHTSVDGARAVEPVVSARPVRRPLPLLRSERAPRLQSIDLSVTYGGLNAVDRVSVEVREGEIVGLIGPNGAGKTSFMDGLTGFTKTSGRIEFRSQSIESEPPHRRMRQGLSRTWQAGELFDDLTVYENLRVTREHDTLRSLPLDVLRPRRRTDDRQVEATLSLLGLSDKAKSYPRDLSLGQQKLAGVARALCSSPAVVLLDEPAAGLDSEESRALGERLCDIAADGTGILLIDHDMGLVLETCDYIYVLEFGRLIAEGTPDEIRSSPAVIEAYLGSEAADVKELAEAHQV
jgi:ABC-type branched-subunit amino acid transport system ATPase component/branched-subunit amino acid ABC-type transport system permease component